MGKSPEGVSGEAAQVGLQVGGQGGYPEARESARDTAMAWGRPAGHTEQENNSKGAGRRQRKGEGGEQRNE